MGTVKEIVKKRFIFGPTTSMVSSLPPYAVLVVVSKRKMKNLVRKAGRKIVILRWQGSIMLNLSFRW
jgi:hypothetical protein